jgi:Cu+-exporting ATPase
MNRRNFIRNVAVAGTGVSLEGAAPRETCAVRYRVKGFTCITCAVGLETMLRMQPGVVRAVAAYPAGTCEIGLDSAVTSDAALRQFIAGCGFSVS